MSASAFFADMCERSLYVPGEMPCDRESPDAALVKARTLATTPLSCSVVPMAFAASSAFTTIDTDPVPAPAKSLGWYRF